MLVLSVVFDMAPHDDVLHGLTSSLAAYTGNEGRVRRAHYTLQSLLDDLGVTRLPTPPGTSTALTSRPHQGAHDAAHVIDYLFVSHGLTPISGQPAVELGDLQHDGGCEGSDHAWLLTELELEPSPPPHQPEAKKRKDA